MVGINIACAPDLSAWSGEERRLGDPSVLHGQQPAYHPQQEEQETRGEKEEKEKTKGAATKQKALTCKTQILVIMVNGLI